MDATVKSIRMAIEMARRERIIPEYVLRRLEEIEWGVDALAAENARLNAVVEAARGLSNKLGDAGYSDTVFIASLATEWEALETALAAVGEGE